MRSGVALALIVPCVVSGLVGASHRPVRGDRNASQNGLPPAYFDFGAIEQMAQHRNSVLDKRKILPFRKGEGLRLIIHLARLGASDVRLDVEVWNLSDNTQLVGPITPGYCLLEFCEAEGKSFAPYQMLPGYAASIHKSDLTPLWPNNCLGATFMLPRFYQRIGSRKRVKVKAELFDFCCDDDPTYRSRPALSSGWVEIPGR